VEAIDLMLELFGYEVSDDARQTVLRLFRKVQISDDQQYAHSAVTKLNESAVVTARTAVDNLPHRKAAA
jgi:hypothetical protein